MQAFPPARRDRVYQQRFAPLGLLDARASPFGDPDPELGRRSWPRARQRMEAA